MTFGARTRASLIAGALTALAPLSPAPARAGDPPEAARAEVAAGALVRSFSLEGPAGVVLASHRGGAATLAVRGEVHPGAFFERSPLADLGGYFELSRSVGLRAPAADGGGSRAAYGTRELGLTARRRVGPHAIATRLGYGNHRVAIDRAAAPGELPSVEYRFLRIEARAHLALPSDLWITPSFAYLPVFGAGALEEAAGEARLTSGGVAARLELAYRLRGAFDLFVSYEYRRFFHDFDPAAGAPGAVAGALDQAHLASAGARYVFRRSARPSAPK